MKIIKKRSEYVGLVLDIIAQYSENNYQALKF